MAEVVVKNKTKKRFRIVSALIAGGVAMAGTAGNFENPNTLQDLTKHMIDYHYMKAKLKIATLFKSGKKKEAAEELLAFEQVMNDLSECVARVQGISINQMRDLYSDNLKYEHEKEQLKWVNTTTPPEQQKTMAQKLMEKKGRSDYAEEQYENATKILPSAEDIVSSIVDASPEVVKQFAELVKGAYEKMKKPGETEMLYANMNFAKQDYYDSLEPFMEGQKKIDELIRDSYQEFTQLYLECKKKKDFNAYHSKMEARVKEIVLKIGMEVDPNFKSKVVQKKAAPIIQNNAVPARGMA